MKELIESTKRLQGEIDKCIMNLIHARQYHDKIEEAGAVFNMERLLVSSAQQLQCCVDKLGGVDGTIEWQTGKPDKTKYYFVQIRSGEDFCFVVDHWNGCYWQLYDGVVIAWSEMKDIKPYKEKEE